MDKWELALQQYWKDKGPKAGDIWYVGFGANISLFEVEVCEITNKTALIRVLNSDFEGKRVFRLELSIIKFVEKVE